MDVNPCKFGHGNRYPSGVCKECSRERSRAYYRKNREKILSLQQEPQRWNRNKALNYRGHLKRTYGITPEQFDAMFAAQDSRCAVCRAAEPGSKLNRWHVDHCHDTGTVRGILCAQCNVMIAMSREDSSILEAGIRYLAEEVVDATH